MKKFSLWRLIKRAFLVCAVLGVLGCAAIAAINIYVCSYASRYIVTEQEAASLGGDCALVLGCAVWNGSTPSPMLEDRLSEGLELYEESAVPKLLLSGDHGREYYDEVGVMRDWCLERGVPSDDIFLDHAGFSTYESVYRARDVFECSTPVIVTQQYHLYRAVYSARALGLNAYGVASDPVEYSGQLFRDAREALARVKDFFYVMFDVQPTFLGDVIPVSGDGNAADG